MSKYSDLLKQIENLQAQAAAAREAEIKAVVAEIKEKIKQYDLSASDLGFTASKRSSKASQVPAKYRDPATGKTWSGRGRMPTWLAEAEAKGKSRDQFAV